MYVQLQTIDGSAFASDPVVWDSSMSPVEVDAAVNDIEELFSYWRDANHISLQIGGRKRFFNPANVVWAEIVY